MSNIYILMLLMNKKNIKTRRIDINIFIILPDSCLSRILANKFMGYWNSK